jgi:hypothetical protein
MPCRRMHSETFQHPHQRLCGGVRRREPAMGGPLPGMAFWHFACAASNAGELGATGSLIAPEPVGSGKSGTPFFLMHAAYSSSWAWKSVGPRPVGPFEVV